MLRSAVTDDGVLCVPLSGNIVMLLWCAGNSDSLGKVWKQCDNLLLLIFMTHVILGASALTQNYVFTVFGSGLADIFLYEVTCTGDESRLQDCRSSQTATCGHTSDVGVRCRYRGKHEDVILL